MNASGETIGLDMFHRPDALIAGVGARGLHARK